MSVNRLAKLKAMSSAELFHRTRYAAYTACERTLHDRRILASPNRLRKGLRRSIAARSDWQDVLLQRTRTPSFFAFEHDAAELRTRFHAAYPAEMERARNIAARLRAKEISFFGAAFSYPSRIDWHADPPTGAAWPKRYHRDVPVEGGDVGFGDVKYVWELNRHQFFVDLAKVALLDGSRRDAESLQGMLRDWHQTVDYGSGVPWACALEPAFRAWSWLWSYHMLLAAGMIDRETHLLWLTGLYDHGRFLYRHLERFSSPYNHLIGEASALFALGIALPEIREAAAWVARARHVLDGTVEQQFHPDGGTVEQSTFYHHATLGFYILAAILGRRHAIELSTRVWDAIERGIEFSMSLCQPDGRVPRIGGADDGKPIRLEHVPLWDFRPYQAIGAVLFSRADFKFAAGRFWEDAFWLLGPRGAEAFERVGVREPSRTAALPASGYFVTRSDWSAGADYLCFDCGEQAGGLRRDAVPSAAHGHADCLSVVAALGGRPVLVDPGFYCYNGAPEWETHFRKTGAHNTISVNGRDQARHITKMAWTHTYAARFEGMSADDLGWARGSHDGFADRGNGLLHRRTVWLRDGGYLLICDELTGRPGHRGRANYQFAPGALVMESADAAVFEDRFELSWTSSVPVEPTIVEGGEEASGGWIATSLGVRERAPRLVLDFAVPYNRVVLLTVLADRSRAASGRRTWFQTPVALQGDAVLGLTVRGRGWDDRVLCAPGGRTIEWQGLETDASLALVRVAEKRAIESRMIDGTRLHVREDALANGMAPLQFAGAVL